MQTLEFVDALTEIVRELQVRELVELMTPWFVPSNAAGTFPIDDNTKNRFSQLLLDSHAGYRNLLNKPAAGPILAGIDIGKFYEPVRFRAMLTAMSAVVQLGQLVQQQQQSFAWMAAFKGELEILSKIQATTVRLLADQKIGEHPADEEIVELELIEYAGEEGFSPKRVQILSESISQLHAVLAILYGSESGKITFKYFDSGSGLLLGILCGKKIAETISTLFSQWFERIVFFKYDDFDKRMAAANKSLAFAGSVEESVTAGVVTREVGENLKRRAFQEMEKLTGIGVTVPITADATINQRQLLTEVRNTKLLTEGNSTSEEPPIASA